METNELSQEKKAELKSLIELVEKIPEHARTGACWSFLLIVHPEKYADNVPWKKLNSHEMCLLLREHPEFADQCDWKNWRAKDWSQLLRKQPQFADKCDWEKMDSYNWSQLLREQPQFADKCP